MLKDKVVSYERDLSGLLTAAHSAYVSCFNILVRSCDCR